MYNLKTLVCAIFLLSSVNLLPVNITITNKTNKDISVFLYVNSWWCSCKKNAISREIHLVKDKKIEFRNINQNGTLGVYFLVNEGFEEEHFYDFKSSHNFNITIENIERSEHNNYLGDYITIYSSGKLIDRVALWDDIIKSCRSW